MPAGRGRGASRSGVFGRLWERFGEVAKRLHLVKDAEIREALKHQEERKAGGQAHRKIGQILVERGKMEPAHVGEVLKEQKKAKKAAPKKAKKAAKKKARKVAKKKR